MLLKNAANKVTKLFGKLSPESQLRLHNSDVWPEYSRYANMEMGLRNRLLDVDERAMKFMKEHPDDYRADLVRMLGKDDDLGYLLEHGVSPEELAANPYFRVSDNVYRVENSGSGAVTRLPDAVDRRLDAEDGVRPKKGGISVLSALGLGKKKPLERLLVRTGDPFVERFDSALAEVKGDPWLVKSLMAFGKDGRVDVIATHRNVLREAATRAIPEAPGGGFLNVSSDKVVKDKFGRDTGMLRSDADIDAANVQTKRHRLERLRRLYRKEKGWASGKKASRAAYRRAMEKLEAAERKEREALLDNVADNVFGNNHEASEVKHALGAVLDRGSFRPAGAMFRRKRNGLFHGEPYYEITGNHYDVGVLADELADSNHPAFWRARRGMYSAKPGDGKGRWDTGEQMFLSNLMGLDDPFSLGRAVRLPDGTYDKIREAVPDVIHGEHNLKGRYRGILGLPLPGTFCRFGHSME